MDIQTSIEIKIGDKNYTINYPTVGQTIDIENLKLALSGGLYGQLLNSNHATGVELLNLIDGVAYFSVLAPSFKTDFTADKFTEMDIFKQKKIVLAFVKKFWPWFRKINDELNKIEEKADVEN